MGKEKAAVSALASCPEEQQVLPGDERQDFVNTQSTLVQNCRRARWSIFRGLLASAAFCSKGPWATILAKEIFCLALMSPSLVIPCNLTSFRLHSGEKRLPTDLQMMTLVRLDKHQPQIVLESQCSCHQLAGQSHGNFGTEILVPYLPPESAKTHPRSSRLPVHRRTRDEACCLLR